MVLLAVPQAGARQPLINREGRCANGGIRGSPASRQLMADGDVQRHRWRLWLGGVMHTRVSVLLLATGLTTVVLSGCQVDRWSSSCTTDTGLRRCEISVAGDGFHDLPFPVSGPVQGSVGDRFRLESASPGGSATFRRRHRGRDVHLHPGADGLGRGQLGALPVRR